MSQLWCKNDADLVGYRAVEMEFEYCIMTDVTVTL